MPSPVVPRHPNRTRPALLVFLLGLIFLGLSACSESPVSAEPSAYAYLLDVDLTADDTLAQIERRTGGEVVSWQPEAGFAVVGVSAGAADELTLQGEYDANENAVAAPELQADAALVWAGKHRAWSSKHRAWSSGWTTWLEADGIAFEENLALWEQVRLPAARALSPSGGAGVKVAVIDTGLDLHHPAFAGKLAPAHEWYDFVDGDTYPQEERDDGAGYGHGTAMAGIVLQVAPNVTLLPLRVLNPEGAGDLNHVIMAIDWAVAYGADVINLSLGTTEKPKTLKKVIEYALEQGVYVVASSGNTGDKKVTYPAAHSRGGKKEHKARFAGVGSVDRYKRKSFFSTYGDKLELLAPGENVHTVAPDLKVMPVSGTSAAAAVVSGAVALGLTLDTSVEPKLVMHLNETGVDLSDFNEKMKLGSGLIDIEAFLYRVLSCQTVECKY